MKIASTASMNLKHDTEAREVVEFLMLVPDTAKVSVSVTPRDRPFDSETVTFSVAWEESK